MTPAIDMNHFTRDVVILYEKDGCGDNILRAALTLQKCTLNGRTLLIGRVMLGKQNWSGRNGVDLYIRSICFLQTTINGDQARLGNAVRKISRPDHFTSYICDVDDFP